MSYTIVESSPNRFMLRDDGLNVEAFATREVAVAEQRRLEAEDLIAERVEDAVLELKRGLAREFSITLDEAHKRIKAYF